MNGPSSKKTQIWEYFAATVLSPESHILTSRFSSYRSSLCHCSHFIRNRYCLKNTSGSSFSILSSPLDFVLRCFLALLGLGLTLCFYLFHVGFVRFGCDCLSFLSFSEIVVWVLLFFSIECGSVYIYINMLLSGVVSVLGFA